MLTQDRIKNLIYYNASTGEVSWTDEYASKRRKPGSVYYLNNGYGRVSIEGKHYYLHRLVWCYHYGAFPSEQIDHIDGNKLNNRIENLREVTHADNQKNRNMIKTNKTGIMGVSKIASGYRAYITVDDRQVHLGHYIDFFEACCARKSAENKYGFHPNHGR